MIGLPQTPYLYYYCQAVMLLIYDDTGVDVKFGAIFETKPNADFSDRCHNR